METSPTLFQVADTIKPHLSCLRHAPLCACMAQDEFNERVDYAVFMIHGQVSREALTPVPGELVERGIRMLISQVPGDPAALESDARPAKDGFDPEDLELLSKLQTAWYDRFVHHAKVSYSFDEDRAHDLYWTAAEFYVKSARKPESVDLRENPGQHWAYLREGGRFAFLEEYRKSSKIDDLDAPRLDRRDGSKGRSLADSLRATSQESFAEETPVENGRTLAMLTMLGRCLSKLSTSEQAKLFDLMSVQFDRGHRNLADALTELWWEFFNRANRKRRGLSPAMDILRRLNWRRPGSSDDAYHQLVSRTRESLRVALKEAIEECAHLAYAEGDATCAG